MSFLRSVFLMLVGLIALPFLLLRFGGGMFRAISHNPFKDMDEERAQTHVRLVASKPSVATGEDVFRAAADLASADKWDELSAMLHDAVASKTMTSPMKRDYEHVTAGARAGLTSLLEKLPIEQCTKAVDQMLERFDAAADAAPSDPARAAIAARAHLDVGWAWRGDGFSGGVSDEGWQKMNDHFQAASARIEPFFDADPLFPPIAHAAHIIARQEGDPDTLEKVYELWRASDAGNPTLYSEHAFHLLPRWGGSHAKLAQTAQRAATIDPEAYGAAPTLWLYLGVLECEPEALAEADPELFVDAVRDHLYLDGTSRGANTLLRDLSELWLSIPIDGAQNEPFGTVREICKDACRAIVDEHLTEIDLDVWDGSATEARQIIGLLYKDEIDEGYLLDFESGALELKKAA